MRSWFACNPLLDSISALITDAITKIDSAPKDSMAEVFSRTQDTICARCGLSGGYAEYLWITENMGSSANKPLFDSLKSALSGE